MARATVTDADVESLLLAVVEEARREGKLPELMVEVMKREYGHDAAALRVAVLELADKVMGSLPEVERENFVRELAREMETGQA